MNSSHTFTTFNTYTTFNTVAMSDSTTESTD
jgi:hypothetical protein